MNLYIPDQLKEEMDRYFAAERTNWSAFFTRAVQIEISLRKGTGNVPEGLDAKAIDFVVERMLRQDAVAEDTKYQEGKYEGFLWAKYHASYPLLKKVATLPAPCPIATDRVSVNEAKQQRDGTAEIVENCLVASGLVEASPKPCGEPYADLMFAAHVDECGSVLAQQSKPGIWSWSYGPDRSCFEDADEIMGSYVQARALVSKVDTKFRDIYEQVGGLMQPQSGPLFLAWARGFIEGAASVYHAIKETFASRTPAEIALYTDVAEQRRRAWLHAKERDRLLDELIDLAGELCTCEPKRTGVKLLKSNSHDASCPCHAACRASSDKKDSV